MRSKSEDLMMRIQEIINETYQRERKVPSVRYIAEQIGSTKSTVGRYLVEMEERGMLARGDQWCGYKTHDIRKRESPSTFVPIVGEIACGTPILAEQNIEGYLTVPDQFLGFGEHFVLRASGDSMINVGIRDGDYVVIRRQSTADEGKIVVALLEDGEATLKRYYLDKKNKRVRLHPENDAMEDMFCHSIEIQGVAVQVIK